MLPSGIPAQPGGLLSRVQDLEAELFVLRDKTAKLGSECSSLTDHLRQCERERKATERQHMSLTEELREQVASLADQLSYMNGGGGLPPAAGSGKKRAQFDGSADGGGGGDRNSQVRKRVPTAYVPKGQQVDYEDDDEGGNVNFGGNHDVEEREIAPGNQMRSTKQRQATAFVKPGRQVDEDDEDDDDGGAGRRKVLFRNHDSIQEIENTGFGAAPAPQRSVKKRVPTAFVPQGADVGGGRGVQFGDEDDEEECDIAPSAQMRSTKNRQATAFVKNAPTQDDDEDDRGGRGVKFDSSADANGTQGRQTKKRQGTAFVPKGAQFEDDDRGGGVKFAQGQDDDDQEEFEVEGSMRSAKQRQATAFVKPGAQVQDDDDEDDSPSRRKKGVSFRPKQESICEIEGTGHGPAPPPMRSVKNRQATTFATADQAAAATRGPGVQFGDAHEEEEHEVDDQAAPMRSAKNRQATAFVKQAPQMDDEDGGGRGVKFHADAQENEGRQTKKRVATAFAPNTGVEDDDDEEEETPQAKKKVDFRKLDSVVEIEGSDQPGKRSVKTRQATAFVPVGNAKAESSGGVQFHDDRDEEEHEVEEASQMRSAKNRQATTFAKKGAVPDDDDGRGGVKFSVGGADEDHEEIEAAGNMRTSKGRQATTFAKAKPASDDEDDGAQKKPARRAVNFRQHDSVNEVSNNAGDDAEEAPQTARPTRKRVPTAFVKPDSMGEEVDDPGRKVGFADDDDEEEEEDDEESEQDGMPSRRPTRDRIPTAFVRQDHGTTRTVSIQETENTKPKDEKRPTRVRLPTAFARAKVSDDEDDEQPANKPAGGGGGGGAGGGKEVPMSKRLSIEVPDLGFHKVDNAHKDTELIVKAIKGLYFFQDLDDAAIDKLISVMDVFEFEDGMNVTCQGSTRGTHFFIVAGGVFQLFKDRELKTDLTRGEAFGESVILLSGAQNATIKAKGKASTYGMRGTDIRKALQQSYQQANANVGNCINDLLASDACCILQKLTMYQKQALYDGAKLKNLVCGDKLVEEGQTAQNEIHILLQGSLSVQHGGHEARSIERPGVVGDLGMLSQVAPATVVASTPAQTLVLEKKMLQNMFGDSLLEVLTRVRLLAALDECESFKGLPLDQAETVAHLGKILKLKPNEECRKENARFLLCLKGEVYANPTAGGDPNEPELNAPATLSGAGCEAFGDTRLKVGGEPWTFELKAGPDGADCMVWFGTQIDQILQINLHRRHDSSPHGGDMTPRDGQRNISRSASMRMAVFKDDKVGALKKVVVLRTLSPAQLEKLAASLEVVVMTAGETVFSQGDEGKEFYIIHRGQLEVLIGTKRVRTLGMGDYVGERALLFEEPRSASVAVTEDAELWKMGCEAFNSVVQGAILDYMKDRVAFQNTKVEMDALTVIRVVGRGGFGVVKMVRPKTQNVRYALKAVSIRGAVEHQQQKALATERSVLAELDHPFVIKFIRSFKGNQYVYFLMELVTGGELLDALDHLNLLNKKQAQFYVGSISLALEFLHERRIAYLDLKGENCLIDKAGYLKIIDFGVAERVKHGRIHAVKGTPLFMAPEVILGKGYTTTADLWSLGVCLFDFMVGHFPFSTDSASNAEVFRAVLKSPLKIPKWVKDPAIQGILEGLLTRDPVKRLACGPEGYAEIKAHPFFEEFDWDALLSRGLTPPFLPEGEVYADDQEPGGPSTESGGTVAEDAAGGEADGWTDPDPSWQEEF